MIRRAVPNDVPYLVSLFKRHHAEMGCSWRINTGTLSRTFSRAIVSQDWLCLVDDGCLLLAAAFESPLGAGKLAQELCFCVTPGKLEAVLLIYENWARSKGCRTASLACEQRFAAFARFYGRHGYVQAEATFTKAL